MHVLSSYRMAKEYSRNRRVGDLVQRELAVLVQRYTSDKNMGIVTISATDVSPDLKNAKIFVTCLGNKIDKDLIITALNENAGQFRHALSKLLVLRVTPKLCFKFDHALERANKMTSLIDSLHLDDHK